MMINIPSEFKVEEGSEYSLVKKSDGTITLIPQIENYFDNASLGELYESLEWDDIEATGREMDVRAMYLDKEILFGLISIQLKAIK